MKYSTYSIQNILDNKKFLKILYCMVLMVESCVNFEIGNLNFEQVKFGL